MTATYDKLELHLAAMPLSRAHAKRIKACGGRYSECRSPYANRRYVLVPASERALIDKLVRTYSSEYRKTTMIARVKGHESRPAWVIVHDVDPRGNIPPLMQFEQKYTIACRQAAARGIIQEPVQ